MLPVQLPRFGQTLTSSYHLCCTTVPHLSPYFSFQTGPPTSTSSPAAREPLKLKPITSLLCFKPSCSLYYIQSEPQNPSGGPQGPSALLSVMPDSPPHLRTFALAITSARYSLLLDIYTLAPLPPSGLSERPSLATRLNVPCSALLFFYISPTT